MNFRNKLSRDQSGSVLFLFGFAFMVLGLSVGVAIDSARVYSVDRRVQMALDAAALSGAKLLNENPGSTDLAQQGAHATFVANTSGISLGEAVLTGFTATPDVSTSIVTAMVNVNVPTSFGSLAGIGNINSIKTSIASYRLVKLEVVLALDVTGSMDQTPAGDDKTKLASLKLAANELVNGLFDDATTDSNVRISVVPWSSGVRPGTTYYNAVTGGALGSGCVVEREGDGATTNSLPTALTRAIPSAYDCPSQAVTPLRGRQYRSSITGMISGLTATGGTAGHIGSAWGWYMISPTWADLHPTGSKPEEASSSVIKVVIVMTDGIFNRSYVGGVESTGIGGYDDTSYTMFQSICAGMRDQSIRVYTVAFDLTDATALDKLQTCASPSNALTASNASQLSSAFRTIAAELNSIKLTR